MASVEIQHPTANVESASQYPTADAKQSVQRRERYLDLSLLGLPELMLCLAGPLLVATLFLVPWFSATGYGTIHGHRGPVTGWQTYTVLRYFLLWCGVGAFILPWMVARRHAVGWRRGEMTAVHGLTGIVLLVLNGLAFRPGGPAEEIHIEVGYYLALALLAAFVYAGASSADHHAPIPRKPPGV
jgi:hypothetical protein